MNPYFRQNDKQAIKLLKASYRCFRNERMGKYFLIAASFLVCMAGIMNRYLPNMFVNIENITELQSKIAMYINLVSGIVVIMSIVLGFYTSRMNIEGVSLQERYECYIYSLKENLIILRPVSQTVIDIYSRKAGKNDSKFTNFYYDSPDDSDYEGAHFDNINYRLRSDYRLAVYVQPFFMTLWVAFCLMIFAIALSFNDQFIMTLINIIIPSLSMIAIIASSWKRFTVQLKYMQNAISIMDQIQRLEGKRRAEYIADESNRRFLQDGLFNHRLDSFTIPKFLVRRHEKLENKESWSINTRSSDLLLNMRDKEKRDKRRTRNMVTELPALSLPDTTALEEIERDLKKQIRQKEGRGARNERNTPKQEAAVKQKDAQKPSVKELVKPAAKEPVKPAAKEPVKADKKESAKEPLEKREPQKDKANAGYKPLNSKK